MSVSQGVFYLIFIMISINLGACSSESHAPDGGLLDDAGGLTPCIDDTQCTPPKTCQEDGYCDLVIGPGLNNNRLAGVFSCQVNRDYGESEVKGRFQGKYVYMEFPGCLVEYYEDQTPEVILWVDGLVTNELLLRLEFQVPPDSQVNTSLAFGATGTATGEYKHLTVDESSIVDEKTVAQVVSGNITFSEFSSNANDRVRGTFVITLQPVD